MLFRPSASPRPLRRLSIVGLLTMTLLMGLIPAASAETRPQLRVIVSKDKTTVRVVGLGFPAQREGRAVIRSRVGSRVVKSVKPVTTGRSGRFATTFRIKNAYRRSSPRVRGVVEDDSTNLIVSAANLQKGGKGGKKTIITTEPDPVVVEPEPEVVAPEPVVAGTYGVDPAFTPVADITLQPGQLTQAALDAAGSGARIAIAPGVHRLTAALVPKPGQQLLGHPGAVLNGSKGLTNWVRDGDHWYVGGQTQRFMVHGVCDAGYEGCRYAEDVFRNNAPLWQVMSRAELRPGTFWFDYSASRIYVADDPTGQRLEATVAPAAVSGPGNTRVDGVVVRNLVVEKFGSPAQHAAIDPRNSHRWQIVNNDVRLNHGRGVNVHSYGAAIGNKVHRNGQMGVGGTGTDLLVDGNEIAHNLTAGFFHEWEGGGTKFALSNGLVVKSNWVHHNKGPGLWTDIDNIHTTYDANLVEDNTSAGIFHEISYDAVIKNNTIRRNGLTDHKWGYGAGIQVSASSNVEVFGNVLEGNARGITGIMQERGSGAYGRHEVANLWVHDNLVTMDPGGLFPAGMFQDLAAGDLTYFTTKGNRWTNNHYRLPLQGVIEQAFQSHNSYRTWAEWRSYGNDLSGTLVRY